MKIKTQKQLDKYLDDNLKKLTNKKTSHGKIMLILEEQNKILTEFIKLRAKQILEK